MMVRRKHDGKDMLRPRDTQKLTRTSVSSRAEHQSHKTHSRTYREERLYFSMINTSSPAETTSEGNMLNDSARIPVVRKAINLSSGEGGDSSSPQFNNSAPKSTHQRCRSQTTWSDEARLGLIQQVTSRVHCLLTYEECVAGLRSV